MSIGALVGKTAIITGGGGDMARGIARAFAKEGASCALLDVNLAAAEANASEVRGLGAGAEAFLCDISDSGAVDATVNRVIDRFGTVDILINNATAARVDVPIEEITDDDLAVAFGTGPFGMIYLMRACFPYLKGSGRVINMRSGSELAAIAEYGSYVGSKAAIGAMTKVAAREWGQHGITVNCIMPYVLHQKYREHLDPELIEKTFANLSIKRSGDAETDVGRTAVFLAGPDASYITGVTIPVSGGGQFI